MREIKFRAFHNLKNRFIDIFDINCFGDVLTVGYSDLGEPGTDITNQIELNQYTGLKDKNGNDIYEGDIVYIAGLGNTEIKFPFIDLYEASMENDIGEIIGNIYKK